MISILVGGYIIIFLNVIDENFLLFIYFLKTTVYDLKYYVHYKRIRILQIPDSVLSLCQKDLSKGCMFKTSEKLKQSKYSNIFR